MTVPGTVSEFGDRLAAVRARIAAAAKAAGRDPASIELVGVAKGQPAVSVRAALAAGLTAIGENRAQELEAKAGELANAQPGSAPPEWPSIEWPRTEWPSIEWHFVGRLQRNKVAKLARRVVCWHSLDRLELVAPLARHAPGGRVFVEVNVAGEPGKGGCDPHELAGLVDAARTAGLTVAGLMTVPPADEDPRPHFAALRRGAESVGVHELSMGMSSDFEVAIAEGATIVRVGEALFGARSRPPSLQR